MVLTSNTLFDITEKSNILIKTAFGFPSTNENSDWYRETDVGFDDYVFGTSILVEEVPDDPDWSVIRNAEDIGLLPEDFVGYNNSDLDNCSIVDDSTGRVRKYKGLILSGIDSGQGQSYRKINGSGVNILRNGLQFNYKKVGAFKPYDYSLKNEQGNDLYLGKDGGNWYIDLKSGILLFNDYNTTYCDPDNNRPVLQRYCTYVGKKGLSEFSSSGGVGGNTLTHLATIGTFQGYMLNTNRIVAGTTIDESDFNTTGDRISGTDVTDDTEIDSFDSVNSIFSMKKSNTPASPLFIREGYLRDSSNIVLYDTTGVSTSDTQNLKFTHDSIDYNCLIDTRSSYDITFKDLRHSSGVETNISENKSTFLGYYDSSYNLVTTAFLTNQFIEEVNTLTRPSQVTGGSNNVYTLQTNSSIQPSEKSVMTGFYKGASKFYYSANSVFDPSAGYYLESLGFTIDQLSTIDTNDSDNGFITINGNNQSQTSFSSKGVIISETEIEMVDLSGIYVGMGVYKPNTVVKKPFITSIDSTTNIITLANSEILKQFFSGFIYQPNVVIIGENLFGIGDVLGGRVETQMPNSTITSALGQQYGIDQSLTTSLLGTFRGFAKDNRVYFGSYDLDFIILSITDQYNTSLSILNQYVPVNNIDYSIYTQYAEVGFYTFVDAPTIDHPTDDINYFNGIITFDTSINTLDDTTLIGTKTGYIKENKEIIFGSVHNDINIGDGFIDGNENILFNPTVSNINGHIVTIPGGENSIRYTKPMGKYIQTGDNTIVVKIDWNYGFEYLDDSETLDWNIINYNDSDYWNTTFGFYGPAVNNLLITPAEVTVNKIQLTHTQNFEISEFQIWVKGTDGPVNIVPSSTITPSNTSIGNNEYLQDNNTLQNVTITFDVVNISDILSIVIYNTRYGNFNNPDVAYYMQHYYYYWDNGGQAGSAIIGAQLNVMNNDNIILNTTINDGSPVLVFSTPQINHLSIHNFSRLDESNTSPVRGYPLIYDNSGSNLTSFNKVRVINTTDLYTFPHAWEVEQIQIWVDGSNIAVNGDVSHNSFSRIGQHGFTPELVIDGNANTLYDKTAFHYYKSSDDASLGEYIEVTVPETDISNIQSIVVFSDKMEEGNNQNYKINGKSIWVMKDDVVIFKYQMYKSLRVNRIDGDAIFSLNEDAFTNDIYNETNLDVNTKIHGFKHSNHYFTPPPALPLYEIPSDAIVTTSNYLYDGLFEVTFSSNVTSQTTKKDNSISLDSVDWNEPAMPIIDKINPATFSHYSYKEFDLYKKESFAALTQLFEFYTLDTLTVHKDITFTKFPKLDISVYSTNTYSYRRPIIFTVPDSDVNDQIVGANSTQTLKNKTIADAFNTLSDTRIKNNEIMIENATQSVMKLRPKTYDLYEDFQKKGDPYKSVGLLVQDVYYLAPELRNAVGLCKDQDGNVIMPSEIDVSTIDQIADEDYNQLNWGDKPVGIKYDYFIPYLIKMNQEQQETIENLKSRLEALENAGAGN